jgi:hypothetical protein
MGMREHLRTGLITGGICLAFGLGCSHHSVPAATGGGPSAAQQSIDSAVERITNARCERESRCGNVGAGKDYDTHEKCLTVMRGKSAEGLPLSKCKGGIDQGGLSDCLTQIQNQKCGDPITAFTRATACRVSELCYD